MDIYAAGRSVLAFVALAVASPHASAGAGDEAPLSSATLNDALRGREMSSRGRIMDGDAAVAFADGYIQAVAERAAADGEWCGMASILPHEVIARVADGLSDDAVAKDAAAGPEVRRILRTLRPCP